MWGSLSPDGTGVRQSSANAITAPRSGWGYEHLRRRPNRYRPVYQDDVAAVFAVQQVQRRYLQPE